MWSSTRKGTLNQWALKTDSLKLERIFSTKILGYKRPKMANQTGVSARYVLYCQALPIFVTKICYCIDMKFQFLLWDCKNFTSFDRKNASCKRSNWKQSQFEASKIAKFLRQQSATPGDGGRAVSVIRP